MANKKTFYISTPIYYPSGKPHIGHAYSTILADVLARYKKLIGYETFFVTGTDEHGKKIEESAKKNNLSTIDFLDKMVNNFKNLWELLGIKYDHFSRTTNKNHIEVVQKIFSKYLNDNLIYLSKWEGLYCVSCEENISSNNVRLIDNQLVCEHGHKLVSVEEESYFFKIKEFSKWIKSYFNEHQDFVYPVSRMNELLNNFIDNDLTDLSISRSSFTWGIPIVENNKHVIYVWMDALFNYLTALNFMCDDDSLYKRFWQNDSGEIVHILSKEITRFHCIYWPIFLHALKIKLPTKILSHGWILADGAKMSKSLNNVIDPIPYLEKFGRDALRYYLIKEISLTNDSTFSDDNFVAIFNGDLANNYGNLVSRTIGMINKYCNGLIDGFNFEHMNLKNKQIIDDIKKTNQENVKCVNDLTANKVLVNVQNLINVANKYIEESKPWELFKAQKMNEIKNMLALLLKIIEVSTFWLSPVLIDGTYRVVENLHLIQQFNLLDDISTIKDVRTKQPIVIYQRIG